MVLLLALAGWFYFWTATSAGSPLTFERPHYDLYNRLADGFLAGRTSFVEEPPSELARLENPYDPAQNAPYKKYHDITYYRGRYYLYFGPTPVILLLAPWKLLTGTSLPQNLAVVVFAWGSALVGTLVLRRLRERFLPATGPGLFLAAVAAVAFGSLWPVLLRRPIYYELAIASAAFCGLVALWCLLRAEGSRRAPAWLAGVGLSLGFAVGGRPDYVLGSLAVLGCLGWAWWRATPAGPVPVRWRAMWRPVLAVGLPFAAAMVALMAYNYARFGSIAEFGTSYMLAGSNQQGVSQVGLRYLPINLYYHIFALPNFGAYFPFVLVTGFPPFLPPAGYGGQENMYGMLVVLPMLWTLLPFWRAVRRGAPAQPWQPWARCVLALALGNLLFLAVLMGAANRYALDYVPVLSLAAIFAAWHFDAQLAGWRRWSLRAGLAVMLAATLGFNLLVSLQHNDLFRHHNPAAYARVAYAANAATGPLTGAAARSGPLRIDLTLPKNRTGKLEPLLVTGVSFRADFLYIFYKDDTHIQIGFEHTSYGGPMSPPIEVDYDVPHVLEVQLGSLYPPLAHPYFDGKAAEETERLKRTLLVKLDGRVIHSGRFDFYDSSPGGVTVGRNPISDAFGRRFTGSVREVTRPASIE